MAKTARLTKGGSISRIDGGLGGIGYPGWKRALDLAVIGLVLPMVVLVSLVLAGWIKVISPGPIFFRQERVGWKGLRFRIWKFRTMHPGADEGAQADYVGGLIESDAPLIKLDAFDDRLIPGARIVRALGLDELPQIFNVLRGEMSLVGPRPCTPQEYSRSAEIGAARAGLRPGITGAWQVSGKSGVSFRQMLALDRSYGQDLSFARDVRILLRTLPVVAGQAWGLLPGTGIERAAGPRVGEESS